VAKLHRRLRSKKGKRRYYYTIRTRGGSEFGGGWNREEAQELVDHYSALERKQRHGIPLPSKSDWTLEDLKKRDLDLAHRDGQEIASRERRWKMILGALGPMTLIDEITAARIGDFTRRRLQSAGVATVRRDRSVLANALARARDPESGSGFEGDPFKGLDSMADQERRARKKTPIFRPETVDAVLAAAWKLAAEQPSHVRPGEWRQNAAILELIYLTSSRESQVRELRRDQLREHPSQPRRLVLWFPAHKRGEERLFDFEGRLRKILEGIPDDGSGWFFRSARADGPRDNFRRFLRLVLKRAKVPGLTLRALRKSKASGELAAGTHPADVARDLGHRRLTTTLEWYAEIFPAVSQARRPPSPRQSPERSPKGHKRTASARPGQANSRGNRKTRARA